LENARNKPVNEWLILVDWAALEKWQSSKCLADQNLANGAAAGNGGHLTKRP
jgi:hypothetical protein